MRQPAQAVARRVPRAGPYLLKALSQRAPMERTFNSVEASHRLGPLTFQQPRW